MSDTTENANPSAEAETQHQDAARTTTESGAAAAAGLRPSPSRFDQEQAGIHPATRKVNAGSSDR